jgi:endonuclease I
MDQSKMTYFTHLKIKSHHGHALKCLSFILLFSVPFSALCQDSAYYSSAFNRKADDLKMQLHSLIKNHKEYPYTSTSTDVWDILKETDKDPANPNNVIFLYSGRSVDAAQEYNSGAGWTREHVWAKSRGNFGTDAGAGTDVHHLRPLDNSVNSTRNNRVFDNCKDCKEVTDNGFNTGSKTDATLYTFEPRDEVKGDVARMIFYMAVRYEGDGAEPDLELTETIMSNTDQSPVHGVKSTLLEWNRLDPVNDWERNRNTIIYEKYQGNRNPFIDYPELADYIFGDSTSYVWKPAAISGIQTLSKQLKVYPNPTLNAIHVVVDAELASASYTVFNSVGVTFISGKLAGKNSIVDLKNLPEGVYYIKVDGDLLQTFKIVKK